MAKSNSAKKDETTQPPAIDIDAIAQRLADKTGLGRGPFREKILKAENLETIAALIDSGKIDDAIALLDERNKST